MSESKAFQVPVPLKQVLAAEVGPKPLRVAGWVRSKRVSKSVSFIALGDGSGAQTLQVVIGGEVPDGASTLAALTTGASVMITGHLVASPAKGQRVELVAHTLEMLGAADAETYPLQKKGHTLEFLRSIPHLRARSNTFGAVYRIRSTLAQATHRYFSEHAFNYVHTPIITTSDSEGAGEMFEVVTPKTADDKAPFFGRRAYLTVSGQLAGEALAYGLGRIYTFGPTFRAENSNTARHLAEFWMIEPEAAFFDLRANMDLAEGYLQACVRAVLADHGDDLAFLAKHYDAQLVQNLESLVAEPFARITYTEAQEILARRKEGFTYPIGWGKDMQSEHERYLCEEHFKKPVIVTDYPKSLKAFYMYQNDDDKTVAAMDVLVPRIGEIIGGSQREHRLDKLTQRLAQMGMDEASYSWYLDLGRYGAVPHAGFGLGFERLVMLCTSMSNIRDVIPFPRAPNLAPC
jgi:asparaginyl-tRNA synthetase